MPTLERRTITKGTGDDECDGDEDDDDEDGNTLAWLNYRSSTIVRTIYPYSSNYFPIRYLKLNYFLNYDSSKIVRTQIELFRNSSNYLI